MPITLNKKYKYLIVDCEANGLNPTKVWCVSAKDLRTGERFRFFPKNKESCETCSGLGKVEHFDEDTLQVMQETCGECGEHGVVYPDHHNEWKDDFNKLIDSYDFVIAHNGLGYDFPVFKRLLGTKLPLSKCWDTLVMSRLFRPVAASYKQGMGLKSKGVDDRFGGHGIGAWGRRLGVYKFDFNDWSNFSTEQMVYCDRDVDVNHLVFKHLLRESKSFSDECIKLEHEVTYLLQKQKEYGFKLDVKQAQELYDTTLEHLEEAKQKLQEVFPPKKVPIDEAYQPRYTKKGKLYKNSAHRIKNNYGEKNKDGTYTLYKWVTFNPNSNPQIVDRLKDIGWKPTKFTDKGNPKTDKETLEEVMEELLLDGADERVKALANYGIIYNRHTKAETWLSLRDENDRVHGSVNSIGASTHRCSHFDDNMANIASIQITKLDACDPFDPEEYGKFEEIDEDHLFLAYNEKKNKIEAIKQGIKGNFGWESRKCWTVEEGNVLLGSDAAGIQLRALAHYIDDPEYTQNLLKSDIHVVHQKAAGLPDRPTAKTFIYAWLLGAGDYKIGLIAGVDEQEYDELFQYARNKLAPYGGRTDLLSYMVNKIKKNNQLATRKVVAQYIKGFKLKEQFLDGIPALKRFKTEEIPEAASNGYIYGLDGRKLWIPSEHLAMSLYLQGFEAVIMKDVMVNYHLKAKKEGIWFRQVGFIHDEFQIETKPEMAEDLGHILEETYKETGEKYGTNCPIEGGFSIGKHWGETH